MGRKSLELTDRKNMFESLFILDQDEMIQWLLGKDIMKHRDALLKKETYDISGINKDTGSQLFKAIGDFIKMEDAKEVDPQKRNGLIMFLATHTVEIMKIISSAASQITAAMQTANPEDMDEGDDEYMPQEEMDELWGKHRAGEVLSVDDMQSLYFVDKDNIHMGEALQRGMKQYRNDIHMQFLWMDYCIDQQHDVDLFDTLLVLYDMMQNENSNFNDDHRCAGACRILDSEQTDISQKRSIISMLREINPTKSLIAEISLYNEAKQHKKAQTIITKLLCQKEDLTDEDACDLMDEVCVVLNVMESDMNVGKTYNALVQDSCTRYGKHNISIVLLYCEAVLGDSELCDNRGTIEPLIKCCIGYTDHRMDVGYLADEEQKNMAICIWDMLSEKNTALSIVDDQLIQSHIQRWGLIPEPHNVSHDGLTNDVIEKTQSLEKMLGDMGIGMASPTIQVRASDADYDPEISAAIGVLNAQEITEEAFSTLREGHTSIVQKNRDSAEVGSRLSMAYSIMQSDHCDVHHENEIIQMASSLGVVQSGVMGLIVANKHSDVTLLRKAYDDIYNSGQSLDHVSAIYFFEQMAMGLDMIIEHELKEHYGRYRKTLVFLYTSYQETQPSFVYRRYGIMLTDVKTEEQFAPIMKEWRELHDGRIQRNMMEHRDVISIIRMMYTHIKKCVLYDHNVTLKLLKHMCDYDMISDEIYRDEVEKIGEIYNGK